ncbi:MAG: glutamine amidotransferase, partial [Clostridia bacterium]|nr:glutamine amidotransferase [Clostridia bacterium]
MELKIAHLYPELLNLYGDKGNIVSMTKRAEWRNIKVSVREYNINDEIDFDNTDILFIGGGSDKEQLVVAKKLCEFKDKFKDYVENNGVVVAICGGFQLMGKYYKMKDDTVEGLGILDMYSEYNESRLTGDIIVETDFLDYPVVGFENHAGRTFINNHSPLGKVLYGNGNNENDGVEGVMYKNLLGTYLHGPLLPKNPQLCDYIIKKALQNKYNDVV